MSTLAGSGLGAGSKDGGAWIDGVGTAAAFNAPAGVAVDASGNVLVADSGNSRVRRVTPDGGAQPPMGRRGAKNRLCYFLQCHDLLFFFQFSLCI